MGPLPIKSGTDAQGQAGHWVEFEPGTPPVFVSPHHWVGVDFDGTLSTTDNPGHFLPPYPLGQPIAPMLELVKSLLGAGVKVKIFSARACQAEFVPAIQEWTQRHGLGLLEVTNSKDFGLIRYYDDRAIQMVENGGCSIRLAAGGQASAVEG